MNECDDSFAYAGFVIQKIHDVLMNSPLFTTLAGLQNNTNPVFIDIRLEDHGPTHIELDVFFPVNHTLYGFTLACGAAHTGEPMVGMNLYSASADIASNAQRWPSASKETKFAVLQADDIYGGSMEVTKYTLGKATAIFGSAIPESFILTRNNEYGLDAGLMELLNAIDTFIASAYREMINSIPKRQDIPAYRQDGILSIYAQLHDAVPTDLHKSMMLRAHYSQLFGIAQSSPTP